MQASSPCLTPGLTGKDERTMSPFNSRADFSKASHLAFHSRWGKVALFCSARVCRQAGGDGQAQMGVA